MRNACKSSSLALRRSLPRWSAVFFMVLLAAACTVGPDYRAPEPPLPDRLGPAPQQAAAAEAVSTDEALVLEQLAWWDEFDDPVLSDLIARGVRGNLDLEIAAARVAEARAVRRAQGGRLLPTVSAAASGGRQKASANGPGPLAELAEAGLASLENDLFTVGFDAAWELDLFGRVGRAREAAQARLEGVEELQRGVLLLVASEIAGAYVELRGAELRLELAERNLGIQEDSLQVIEGKVDSGLLSPIDAERTRAERASLVAALAPLRAQREAAGHRLAVLLGESPGALRGELAPGPVPEPPAWIGAGQPQDLLSRRPDVRRAERELHAATAEVGVAIGERIPRLVIGGSRGQESADLGDLLESASRTWSFGPRIELPIFRGGQLAAGVEAARARLAAADAGYRSAVLLALEEVESSLVAYRESRAAHDALDEAASASGRAADLAEVLYDEGLRDHLVLLDAQRSQTAADDGLALARVQRALRALDVYRALGGGWEILERWAAPAPAEAVADGAEAAVGE